MKDRDSKVNIIEKAGESEKATPLLTVFTPTYNREKLLPRVYESLKNQSCRAFKWLIVDDGSGDATGEIVEGFCREGILDISYIYQENGGKMRAHNRGVKSCDTPLFVCLDSDDIFTPDAVERILETWEKRDSLRTGAFTGALTGILAYKGERDPAVGGIRPFGNMYFPKKSLDKAYCGLSEIYLDGFKGETTLVFVTDYLKRHLFPEIEGEKYVPEDYVYDQIDEEGKLIMSEHILTVCELKEGGYTDIAGRLRRENPTGWFLYYEQRSEKSKWSLLKLKYLSHYLRFCRILGKKPQLPLQEYLIALPGALVLQLLGKS